LPTRIVSHFYLISKLNIAVFHVQKRLLIRIMSMLYSQ
jgi:hypothetical protein